MPQGLYLIGLPVMITKIDLWAFLMFVSGLSLILVGSFYAQFALLVPGIMLLVWSYYTFGTEKKKRTGISEVVDSLGLDYNWASAILCLVSQEIAVKKKLIDLGMPYDQNKKDSDGNPMSPLRQLEDAYKIKGLQVPEIVSHCKAWTGTRARAIHDGKKIETAEARSLFDDTKALLKVLGWKQS
jgi:hypothetical protein